MNDLLLYQVSVWTNTLNSVGSKISKNLGLENYPGPNKVSSNNKLKPIIISKDVGKFIDELPILFTLAAKIPGISKFRNVGALKNKESDRLLESKKLLQQAGIKCKVTNNSMIIYGKEKITKKEEKGKKNEINKTVKV